MTNIEMKMVLRLKKTSRLVHKFKACECIVFWERGGEGGLGGAGECLSVILPACRL